MEYTVNLIFTKTLDQILLQKKAKTEFAGMLNGPGGKKEPDELPIDCAHRKVLEETGLSIPTDQFQWVGTLYLPHDCATGRDGVCILHFYAVRLGGIISLLDNPDEPLSWYGVENVVDPRTTFPPLAGEGNLKYFISQALKVLRGEG